MTDPLLTIEDATREFRVSPKTIRRRLAAGEIVGAYKRPGNRGPEWVMPRESLAAAGFTVRQAAVPAALPTDPDARASYWERRAGDAEAALKATTGPAPAPRRPRDVGALAWAFVGISLVVGLLAGLVVFRSAESADDEVARPTSGTMAMVASVLEDHTDPGEAVGLVGERRTDAIPAGRVIAPSPTSGWGEASGPRFVVATFDGASPPATVVDLQATAELVMRAPHAGYIVEVYDRGRSSDGAPDPSPDVAAPPTSTGRVTGTDSGVEDVVADVTSPEDGLGGGTAAPGEPSTSVASAPSAPTAETGVAPSASPPTEVQVARGQSFWTIAEDVLVDRAGTEVTDAEVAAYWSSVVAANADRLVEPGNADLLHVGQQVVLPPLT